ncbi:MAG TPA: SusD/RagB family nutrient-binding outer membrane lipoprotein [Chryseolinea sp.]|nr:SusD/RagB family nutrient-binding outer membrane lipoprotein [Chryseolinea sp.]
MKTLKILLIAGILVVANACKDFEELQLDPNRPVQAAPGLLLTGIETTLFDVVRGKEGAMLASRMIVFTDGSAAEQYYSWQRNNFDGYNILRQISKMDEEAERTEQENYKSLALFLKSVAIIEITRYFGDVPYSQAVQAPDDVFKPGYDLQQNIYAQVLTDLEQANATLDLDKGPIAGDVIFNGDIQKWKKLINSYTLRVLMSLSLKPGNTSLNIKNRFKAITDDPAGHPIFTSNDDNAALVYDDKVNTRYPYLNSNNFKTAYYMEESFVNLLKDREDPRLFTFADPTPDGSALPETDFDAYGGLDGSAPLATNTNRLVDGEASRVDERYYSDPVNEPSVLIGYAELEFTLAEASARGWIADDPEEHYNNGIRASMDFYNVSSADQDDYLAHPDVAYSAADGIEMIVTQKYINFFLNGGWEPFHNQLRTGFPEFSVDGGGVLNDEQIPKRWMYPTLELQLNEDNVLDAIDRQYGDDNINGVMWLLKPE